MRILFLHRDLPPDSYTGVAIQVHRLANALAALGHDVTVRTQSARPPDARYRVLSARGPLLSAALAAAPFLKRLWHPLWYRFLDYEGYDAIHVHGDGGFLKYRGNWVRTFYGTAGLEWRHSPTLKGKLAQGLSYWMERRESRRCALCVGISPHVASFLPGVRRVIPCMLPSDPDSGPSEKTDHPSLVFLGSRGSRKRGELALAIYRTLRPRFPSLRLTYVGPEREVRELRGFPGLEAVDFRSRVRQEELTELYRRSWVYLCLSSYEGFGVGLIEAMAHSCLVLTTPHPGSDFLIRHGETGLVAGPGEAGEALDRILRDVPGRLAMAARALEFSRRFSPARVASEYLEIYGAARSRVPGEGA